MSTRGVVEIHAADGVVTRHSLGPGAMTIGAGHDAEFRFDAGSGLSSYQLSLRPSVDAVRVDVADGAPSGVSFAGREYWSVEVPWGEEVYLGATRLSFVRSNAAHSGSHAVLLLVGLVAVALIGAASAEAFEPALPSTREVEAPSLVRNAETCPASDSVVAEHRARAAERAAAAKRARFAFSASDGTQALRLYQESMACFGRAGREKDRARVGIELAHWEGRLNEEYGSLRLRLRVALDHGRDADALPIAIELESLLVGYADGPYVEWLSALRHELEEKSARRG